MQVFRAGFSVYPARGETYVNWGRKQIYFLQPGFSLGHRHFLPQMDKVLIEIYSRLNITLVRAVVRAYPYWQDVHLPLASWTYMSACMYCSLSYLKLTGVVNIDIILKTRPAYNSHTKKPGPAHTVRLWPHQLWIPNMGVSDMWAVPFCREILYSN